MGANGAPGGQGLARPLWRPLCDRDAVRAADEACGVTAGTSGCQDGVANPAPRRARPAARVCEAHRPDAAPPGAPPAARGLRRAQPRDAAGPISGPASRPARRPVRVMSAGGSRAGLRETVRAILRAGMTFFVRSVRDCRLHVRVRQLRIFFEQFSDVLSARRSRIRETQMRVPRMHGLPPQTSGSMLMRSRRLAIEKCYRLRVFGSGGASA